MPKAPNDCSTYGDKSIKVLLQHYGRKLPVQSVVGDEFVMPAFVDSDLPTECKTYQRYIANQPKEDMNEQLKELFTNSMLETMCPSLNVLVKNCLTCQKELHSVERSISRMKKIKSRLRNRLGNTNLSHLMKIALELPQTLSDEELELIVDI